MQHHADEILPALVPTSFIDELTIYSHEDGWIESNILSYIHNSMSRASGRTLAYGHQLRIAHHLCDPKPTRIPLHTPKLYVRSGQLPTADLLHSRGLLSSPRCHMGCDVIEDAHHIFVNSTRYEDWRAKAAEELEKRTSTKLLEKGYEDVDCIDFLLIVKSLSGPYAVQ